MAEEEEETETPEAEEESGGGFMKKMMVSVIALALLGGGAFAVPTIRHMILPPADDEGEAAEEDASSTAALYASLAPPLVVNIKDSYGEIHFMQITMDVMARDQKLLNAVREHAPAIRNNLILLFGAATYDDIITREGKEKLLADGLAEIQAVMLDRIGDGNVEALYFTSLIIQ